MKRGSKLVFATLIVPALLLAQTQSNGQPAQSQPNDNKPAYAQPADASGPDAKTSAATPQVADKPATSPAAAAEKPKPKAPVPYPIMSTAAKNRARQLYDYFLHGQHAQLYASYSPGMRNSSTQARLTTVSKQVTAKLGTPGELLSENFLPSLTQPITVYTRVTKYSKSKEPVFSILAVNEQGELDTLQIAPVLEPPKDEYVDYQDKVKLRLPFDGTWMVSQGGRKVSENAYAGSEDDRYAVSFMFLKDGRPFENDGKKNEDFYCWGQPVLAPAAGMVVQIVGNAPDHAPGNPPETVSRGNYVVIAHGNSEFSLVPYLKAGSIKVRNGRRVKEGDKIGECGNSGSSTAPHIAYRLQNTRGFPLPKSLPAQFVDYAADGKEVASGEPVRGQTVANKEKAPAVETAAKPQ